MDNNQLYVEFYNIGRGNPLEVELKLKQLKKEYKKSNFYKQTRMSIRRAYNIFKQNLFAGIILRMQNFFTVEGLASRISEILDNIDSDSLQNLIDTITNALDINKINEQKGDLTNLLDRLKTLG